MSDAPQGPGWWQASDGKWYPPEQHPGNVPPPPGYGAYGPPPAGGPPYAYPSSAASSGREFGPVDSRGRPLAEWWQRLLAIFIDGLIIGIVYSVLVGVVTRHAFRSSFTHFRFTLWLVELIVGLGGIAYFAFLEGTNRGQSLGQMVLGIAVCDAATGEPIGPQRAGVRMVILYPWLVLIWIPFVGPLLTFVGDIWSLVCGLSPLWNPKRQGYHDIAQRTTVIRLR